MKYIQGLIKVAVVSLGVTLASSSLAESLIYRLTSDGSVDTSFNGNGRRIDGGVNTLGYAIAQSGSQYYLTTRDYSASAVYVSRINGDGSVDTSFGYLGVTGATDPPGDILSWQSVGAASGSRPMILQKSHVGFHLLRLTATGASDTAYGLFGKTQVMPSSSYPQALMQVIGGDKVVVAGSGNATGPVPARVVRVNNVGAIEKSTDILVCGRAFNVDSMNVDSTGSVFMLGHTYSDDGPVVSFVLKYTSALTSDGQFAPGGIAGCANGYAIPGTVNVGYGGALAVDASNRVVVAVVDNSFRVRFLRLDGFGVPDGWAGTYSVPGSPSLVGIDHRLQVTSTGNYMIGGSAVLGSDERFLTIRLSQWGTGGVDTTYGFGGYRLVSVSGRANGMSDFVLDTSQRMVCAGGLL